MFEEIITVTRPKADLPWAWDIIISEDRSIDYIEQYVATGKVKDFQVKRIDEFTTMYIRQWDSRESFDHFLSNPHTIDAFKKYKVYNNEHGITVEKNY
jgi:hypothetical protein